MGKRNWKKWVACGDNHGALIDEQSRRAFLKFVDHWQPDLRVHVGDCFDFAGLRIGIGNEDSAAADDLRTDLLAGFSFLEAYAPHVYLVGNHEDRLWRIRETHTNGAMRYAARDGIDRLRLQCRRTKTKLIPYHAEKGIHRVANGRLAFMHGYTANQNAVKEAATHYATERGTVIMGHLHRVEVQTGKRQGGTWGYSIGCMADFSKMTYAKNRLATSAWENAWAFGVYKGETPLTWLARRCGANWILPTGMEEF